MFAFLPSSRVSYYFPPLLESKHVTFLPFLRVTMLVPLLLECSRELKKLLYFDLQKQRVLTSFALLFQVLISFALLASVARFCMFGKVLQVWEGVSCFYKCC
jgi:hypothetical protein